MDKDITPNNEQLLSDGRKIKELRSWQDWNTLYKEVLVTPTKGIPYRNIVKTSLLQGISS